MKLSRFTHNLSSQNNPCSSLALACIYFERLCLDCRVDKSNRRLTFAACLLLAAKVNESNSMICYDRGEETKKDGSRLPLMTSRVKPNKKSGQIFESLIVFFTHEWSLSLKQLYSAEWICFSALGFSLKAKPSEVAFHFRRLLRVLEWNARSYLGAEMYNQWKDSLSEEKKHNERRKAKREARIKRNERKLLKLQRKLHMQQQTGDTVSSHSSRRSSTTLSESGDGVRHEFGRRHSDLGVGPVYPDTCPIQSNVASDDLESPSRARKQRPRSGILNLISRTKHNSSHGKNLHSLVATNPGKLPQKSVSVPNLMALASGADDITSINEADDENNFID